MSNPHDTAPYGLVNATLRNTAARDCDQEHIERRMARIEALLELILAEVTRPLPKSPRQQRSEARYRLIFEAGEHLGRDMTAARKLRELIVGAAVTHDHGLARRVAALRRDTECPISDRRLWSLLRYLGGKRPD